MTEPLDILAIGAHPDDVELGCGGALAQAAAQGRRVGIAHLTRGELGTRGTPEGRAKEAAKAARILGASELRFLDCGDGGLRIGRTEEDAVVSLLRELRPHLVFAPPAQDRHPDHARAHRLVRDACYYAGLAKRTAPGNRDSHRPATVLCYELHDSVEPSLAIDVGSTWEVKVRALEAHQSQFWPASKEVLDDPAAETKISSRVFWQSIEARARVRGLAIGAEFAEGFVATTPLALTSVAPLLALPN